MRVTSTYSDRKIGTMNERMCSIENSWNFLAHDGIHSFKPKQQIWDYCLPPQIPTMHGKIPAILGHSGKNSVSQVSFKRWIPDSLGTRSTSAYYKQRKRLLDKTWTPTFLGGPRQVTSLSSDGSRFCVFFCFDLPGKTAVAIKWMLSTYSPKLSHNCLT